MCTGSLCWLHSLSRMYGKLCARRFSYNVSRKESLELVKYGPVRSFCGEKEAEGGRRISTVLYWRVI